MRKVSRRTANTVGANGACGLLSCAAKRSGAFPPNTPAWAEGVCVMSRRFHEAALRVIVSSAGAPALFHHGYMFQEEPHFSLRLKEP